MRNRIKALLSLAVLLAVPGAAIARAPSVADLDAASRAGGNRMEIARAIGEKIFATEWPVQIFRVYANGVGDHTVVGLGLYGVKFHREITRAEFVAEVSQIVTQTFAADPSIEEVDIWTVVPISVGKGVVVTGDLAKPTTRTVFTASLLRAEAARLTPMRFMNGPDVYWDEDWTHVAFKEAP